MTGKITANDIIFDPNTSYDINTLGKYVVDNQLGSIKNMLTSITDNMFAIRKLNQNMSKINKAFENEPLFTINNRKVKYGNVVTMMQTMTQEEYDALEEHDPDIYYFIVEEL